MTEITLNKIRDLYLTELYYKINSAKSKLQLFEKKYNSKFDTFEKSVISREEDFEKWDDYIEWKAYIKTITELETLKADLESGNFKVS